jgi:hypothetical protein
VMKFQQMIAARIANGRRFSGDFDHFDRRMPPQRPVSMTRSAIARNESRWCIFHADLHVTT